MIAIFSTEGMEVSTEQVMEWILHLGGSCQRINGEELGEMAFAFELAEDGGGSLEIGGQRLDLDQVGAVWYRRTGNAPIKGLARVRDEALRRQAAGHIRGELDALKRSLYARLGHARWLSHTDSSSPNKFAMLQWAREAGLKTPRTLLTTDRKSLRDFRDKVGELVVKPVSDTCMYPHEGVLYNQFTTTLDEETLQALPDRFFPLLAQEKVHKRYEIRCFYFREACDAMAIFSQADAQTATDFRLYNYQKRARTVPYKLDAATRDSLVRLMARLNLETGSVDFIKGVDGQLYFLEVNPVGQFGMVSHPCNYRLERRIAKYLIEEDQACRPKTSRPRSPN